MKQAVCMQSVLVKSGRVFKFYTDTVTLPNGITLDMEIIRHPGAAAVVPMMADGSVLLLKQYRHAVDGYIWEIPAGTLEPGEDPYGCACRELAEETGYRALHMEKLSAITPLPAYSNERIHLFLATGLEKTTQNLDADELLTVHRVDWRQAIDMVACGDIQDAKTIAGLHLAAARRK